MNAGEILDSTYEIKEKIGAGGGGIIYRAYHKRLHKDVVLKKINRSSADNEKEKEILKNLKHSYLPQVYDFLEAEDGIFTVIDYIPGSSFSEILKKERNCSQKKVIKYGIELCEAVEYLHSQKPPIIHGDIKPANLMLTPQDDICLIDFNISGVLDGNSMVASGYTKGYAAPEQIRAFGEIKSSWQKEERTELLEAEDTEILENEATEILSDDQMDKQTEFLPEESNDTRNNVQNHVFSSVRELNTYTKIDERSDIYSIGATLYHMLTGIKPSGNPEEIRKPSEINPKLGESISIILMKALSAEPTERFQNVSNMLQALRKIYKYDSRYKRMLVKQQLILIFSFLCVGIGILLAYFGQKQIDTEKDELYIRTVQELSEAVNEQQSQEQIESLYLNAQQQKPERLEAYLQKAIYLYESRQNEECISFIEKSVLTNSELYEQDAMSEIYFLLGNSYFDLENYKQAVVDYRTAVKMGGMNPEYYRDYAIALARNGELEEAREVLKQAENAGISSVDLMMINGELEKLNGEYAQAESNFKNCIEKADNDSLKLRAYIMCDLVYREMIQDEESNDGRVAVLLKSVEILEKARTDVNPDNQLLIYEHLAQSYIDLLELTSDSTYGTKAVEILKNVIDLGWGDYTTYNNIAILHQKIGQLEECEEVIHKMLDLDSQNYTAYKRLAFLEVEKQNQKKNENRSYQQFEKYYQEAKNLYSQSIKSGGDTEMQLLDNLHQQLIDGGWLK